MRPQYSVPVLGLIFLRYADHRFTQAEKKLTSRSTGRRTIGKADYQAQGVLYLPESARFSNLLKLPEGADIIHELGKSDNLFFDALTGTIKTADDRTPIDSVETLRSALRAASSYARAILQTDSWVLDDLKPPSIDSLGD